MTLGSNCHYIINKNTDERNRRNFTTENLNYATITNVNPKVPML